MDKMKTIIVTEEEYEEIKSFEYNINLEEEKGEDNEL